MTLKYGIRDEVIVATRIIGEKRGRVVCLSPDHDLVGVEIHEYPGSLLWVEESQLMLSHSNLEDALEDAKRRIVALGGGAGNRISV